MPSSEEQKLLNDVLRDADYATFRAEVYEMSLKEFNGGRERPVAAVFLAVAAVAVVATLIALSLKTQKEPRVDQQVVTTTPTANDNAPELFFVKTGSLSSAEVVRSVPDQSQLIHTQVGSLAALPFVHSDPATLSPMQDIELLALFTSDSLGFLRTGKGESLYYFAAGRRPRLE